MVIFKAVGEGRPYPDHGYNTPKDWAALPPRPVRLDELVTTKRTLDLEALLAEDSTFFGDLFPHVWSTGASCTWRTACTVPSGRRCISARRSTRASW